MQLGELALAAHRKFPLGAVGQDEEESRLRPKAFKKSYFQKRDLNLQSEVTPVEWILTMVRQQQINIQAIG